MKDKLKTERIDRDGKHKGKPHTFDGFIVLEEVTIKGRKKGFISASEESCLYQLTKRQGESMPDFIERMTKSGWIKYYTKFNNKP